MTEFGQLLFGGDYNPDQWLHQPDVLVEDIRLMKLASVNCVSLGIFAWAALEPEEGRFEFAWLDDVIERLHANGISINLATPSGAKPVWMALKYPEIRRVNSLGQRDPQRTRHNHCWTSPVYREKVRIINTKLSERYDKHPGVILWHLSNEYGGECFCDLCFAEFRKWLKARYKTIDSLNRAYWAAFWSHTVGDWDEITYIDESVHGLKLDWQRFTSDRCVDFIRHEIAAIRAGGSDRPVTTNMMSFFPGLNYWDQAPLLDIVSQDAYPCWHGDRPDSDIACETAFVYDFFRSLKHGNPWLLMESTPTNVNWRPVSRPKQPGMLRLSGLQAIAHGSTSVMYFQWRKGQGGSEKFHGAMVDHVGHENTRSFQEAIKLGADLAAMSKVATARTKSDVAIVFDWDSLWAVNNSQNQQNTHKNYQDTCYSFYRPFWKQGVAVDVIDSHGDFDQYKLVIAPMLHLIKPGVAERLQQFVQQGGTLVGTYLTGQVNEKDLCFTTGFPGPLRSLFGVWAEETDVSSWAWSQSVSAAVGNRLGLTGSYAAREFCDVIHLESGQALATYESEFYAGGPALTVNPTGSGNAYYVASRNEERFQDDFIHGLLSSLGIQGVLGAKLPAGVSATRRENGESTFTFLMNFNPTPVEIALPTGKSVTLPAFGCEVLETKK